MSIIGAATALLTSLLWALAATLYRGAAVEVGDPLATNWLRAPLALAFMATLSWSLGELDELAAVLQGGWRLSWILLATTLAIILGDTFYLMALRDAGVSIGYPVGYTYPLYASMFAVALLGEQATLGLAIGLPFALAGIWTASFNPPRGLGNRKAILKGVSAAVAAGLCWGLGSVVYRVAVIATSPINVNLVKLLYLIIATSPFAWRRRLKVRRQALLLALLGGLIGLGAGDWLFYASLSMIGVAETVTLTTFSPLASLLLARLLLHEEASSRQALGASMIVAGVCIAVWL